MSAINSVLTAMQDHYQAPFGKTPGQQERSIALYHRVLSDYGDADLLEAWDRIVASHKHKDESKTPNWPGIDVWKRHLADIAAKDYQPKPFEKPPRVEKTPLPDQARILTSPGGQIALKAGCGGTFLTKCRDAREVLDADFAARLTHEIAANLKARSPVDKMHHAHQARIQTAFLNEQALARQYLKDAA